MSICSRPQLASLGICLLMLGCGGDRTGELIAQLKDADLETRRTAVRELADDQSDRASVALAAVVDDSDADIRRLAINSLGRRGPNATAHLPSILPALKDPQLSVRLAAAFAIQSIEPGNAASVPVLLDALRAGEGGIFMVVAEMGPSAQWAVPTLIRLLSRPETKIRRLAAFTLGQLGPTAHDAEPALTRALKDPQEVVRDAAQQALKQINSTPVSGAAGRLGP